MEAVGHDPSLTVRSATQDDGEDGWHEEKHHQNKRREQETRDDRPLAEAPRITITAAVGDPPWLGGLIYVHIITELLSAASQDGTALSTAMLHSVNPPSERPALTPSSQPSPEAAARTG